MAFCSLTSCLLASFCVPFFKRFWLSLWSQLSNPLAPFFAEAFFHLLLMLATRKWGKYVAVCTALGSCSSIQTKIAHGRKILKTLLFYFPAMQKNNNNTIYNVIIYFQSYNLVSATSSHHTHCSVVLSFSFNQKLCSNYLYFVILFELIWSCLSVKHYTFCTVVSHKKPLSL